VSPLRLLLRFPAARNRLACLLKQTGRLEEAETWYRRALDERNAACETAGDNDYDAYPKIMYNLAVLLKTPADRKRRWACTAAPPRDAEATRDVTERSLG
jgi:hypothetical protein